MPTALIDPDGGSLWKPADPAWSHATTYKQALGLMPLAAPLVAASELVLYQDYVRGSHKRARHDRLRATLQARFRSAPGAALVYIRRGSTGAQRMIVNEAALIDQLNASGWKIVDIATDSVEQIQRAVCAAQVVVSIDGSHLDHAHLSLRAGGTMVVLMPHDRFSMRQLGLCRAHGVKPGFVVLEGDPARGYHADLSELLRTIDLCG